MSGRDREYDVECEEVGTMNVTDDLNGHAGMEIRSRKKSLGMQEDGPWWTEVGGFVFYSRVIASIYSGWDISDASELIRTA